jgi:hypothetical protein
MKKEEKKEMKNREIEKEDKIIVREAEWREKLFEMFLPSPLLVLRA